MKNFFSGLLFIIFFTGIGSVNLSAQNRALNYADSMFMSQKYTEAFQDYEQIYKLNQASPSMLMKMAFIKEGLGDYAEALYYLNIYYKLTSDKEALNKMREIAEEHNLTGYEYSDFKFFLNTIQKYETEITITFAAFSLFLLAYIFKQKKKGEQPISAFVLQLISVCCIAILVNGLAYHKSAIVAQDKSLLMSGPSAAAEPLNFIEKGHRVEVLKEDDIWSKIKWEGNEAYIRNKNLKMVL